VVVAADTATWIGVAVGIVGALAGIAGLWGVFRWFRPAFRARIDERRQAIRLDVTNKGRAGGWIREVAAIDAQRNELDAAFAGLEGERFRPVELPGHTSWWLILAASRANGPFPEATSVLVRWGRGSERTLAPEKTKGVSYYGMNSQWP
jgi:hypothetical protein